MTLPKFDVLIDSHCHLLDAPLWEKLPDIVRAAFSSEVHHFIVPSSRARDFERQTILCNQHACVTPAFGIHPFFVHEINLQHALTQLETALKTHPHALVGEIGLDFGDKNLSDATKNAQIEFFTQQLTLAKQYQRPVILHHRASLEAMLKVVKTTQFNHGGFLHAYASGFNQAQPWLKLGFKIGLGSVLLKPNARKIYQLLPHLGPNDYVLETDAPYMWSSGMQNDYNEPANTRQVAEVLATFYQVPWQTIASHSYQNTMAVLKRMNHNTLENEKETP